jgi:AraC family transcriptional regulator of arabinose operon
MPAPIPFGFNTGLAIHDRTDPHRVLRPFGTDVWFLEYGVAGRAIIHDGSESFQINAGDFLLIPAGVRQDYHMDPSVGLWEHLWIGFTPSRSWHASLLAWPRPTGYFGKITISDDALRAQLHQRMALAVTLGTGPLHRRELFVLNIVKEILLWCETVNPLSTETWLDPRIRETVHYLCYHLSEAHEIAQLAERCQLSPSRFAHLFHEQVGQTPLQYLETQRIARARTLLVTTSLSVTRIADTCGFPTVCYFSRIFKRHTGATPTACRRAHAT